MLTARSTRGSCRQLLRIFVAVAALMSLKHVMNSDGWSMAPVRGILPMHASPAREHTCSVEWNITAERYGAMRSYRLQRTYFPVFPASFWFVKVHKVGGSTLAGIFRSIAAHYGIHMINPEKGTTNLTKKTLIEAFEKFSSLDFEYFGIANHMQYHNITAPTAYLRFTAVRHPIDRAISGYYFKCGKKRSLDDCRKDEDRLLQYLRAMTESCQSLYALGDTNMENLDKLDFVFVTDRMDESLVAFKLVFGLRWNDIAYLPSKILNDQYETFSEMPESKRKKVSEILSHKTGSDFEFYSRACRRLNETISQIDSFYGPGTFLAQLNCFNRFLDEVGRRCANTPSENRWQDNGKNFRCIDSINFV